MYASKSRPNALKAAVTMDPNMRSMLMRSNYTTSSNDYGRYANKDDLSSMLAKIKAARSAISGGFG